MNPAPTPDARTNGLGRRHFLALLATPVLVALVDACSSNSSGESPSGTAGEARGTAARSATSVADAADATAAVNAFGMDLYRLLAATNPAGNLVVSPASIAMALTMVAAGARGSTLDELITTLRITDPTTIHHAMNALAAELEQRTTADVSVAIANSLWAQDDLAIESPFLDVLSAEYDAGLHLVDYRDAPDAARAQINDWVDVQTAGRIPQLLGDGAITPAARLTVVNAVYLTAPWAQSFDPAATREGTFATSSDDLVRIPMMFRSETMPYAAGDGWVAVELAYEGDELAMLILVPEPGFRADFEQIFLVTDALPYLASAKVNLSMPRFEIKSELSLAEVLQGIGLIAPFADDADFTGITTAERLKISDVIHQANITVDEGGTEAAAATAVIMETGAAPGDEPVTLTIDQPFVFVLRDRTTGAILFLGRVGEPLG